MSRRAFQIAVFVMLWLGAVAPASAPRPAGGEGERLARQPDRDRQGGRVGISPANPTAPARALVQQGNEHYAAGRYAEALQCYQDAQTTADARRDNDSRGRLSNHDQRQRADILHNQAAAHFKLGEIDAARDLWVRLKESPDPAFEARTRYNLGNCDYAEALAAAGQPDARAALQRLASAAEQYRAALRLDATLTDARANLELAEILKREIEEQQSESPQSQHGEQQDQSDQQQSQNEPASQPSSQPGQSEQQPESQSSADQSPEESPPPPPQPKESNEEPRESQSDAEQKPQPPPSEPKAEPGQEREAQERPGQESPPIEMTREQAERLLQMVRDAERARREALARQQAARQKPVDRDW